MDAASHVIIIATDAMVVIKFVDKKDMGEGPVCYVVNLQF